jgi:Lon protease-like protein
MLKKSLHRQSDQLVPTRLPKVVAVLNQKHHVAMPFVKTPIRIWEPRHRALMEALHEAKPGERWLAIINRDLQETTDVTEEGEVAVLTRVKSIKACENEGYDLLLSGVERIMLTQNETDLGHERSEFRLLLPSPTLQGNTNKRLDQLVQAAFQLAQSAYQAKVELGALLEELPHRRALLYRMAALLVQDPTERLAFLTDPSTSSQVDSVLTYIARALQVMNRRRDRNIAVGP